MRSRTEPVPPPYAATDGTPPPTAAGGRRSGGGPLLALLALLVVALLAWALWATFWQDGDSAGPDVGVTLSDIAEDPEEYYGQRVVVSGQIDDVLEEDDAVGTDDTGAAGFVLGDDSELLVIGANLPALAAIDANDEIAEGDVVQVTGTVQAFDEAEFESELGADLEEGVFEDFDDRPSLRATAVSLVPVVASQGDQLSISLEALEDDPSEFLGSQLTVREAAVEELISPRVAALSDDVLLVTPANSTALTDDQAVEVNGRVVEVSTVQLVNELNLENEDELFTELEVTESDLDGYDVAVVAVSVTPGR